MTIYHFRVGSADGDATQSALLGSKGANLAELCRLGIPVPPGFTIPTTAYAMMMETPESGLEQIKAEVVNAIKRLEQETARVFGSGPRPLLLSVRAGAQVSMPGMMETILNLGINDETAALLAQEHGGQPFANDTYQRFLDMYLQTVVGVAASQIDGILLQIRREHGLREEATISQEASRAVIGALKKLHREKTGFDFPEDPLEQLWRAIAAVFQSWNCARARKYRAIHNIADSLGTAVNICTMVYGNRNSHSGSGVCFTRDPSTGEKRFVGEYLLNAQGDDVVSGVRTPRPLSELQSEMPDIYQQLEEISLNLESHFREIQDLEFTIEERKLWILQTRRAKRTSQASFRIAVDFVEEGILSKKEAISQVEPSDFERILLPSLDPRAHKQVLGRGLPASPGAASGKVVFSSADAEVAARRGEPVILVREETSPDDIAGVHVARGLLTTRGGMTSHAAIVARQMGRCCVVGCGTLQVVHSRKVLRAGTIEISEGEYITIDGSSGDVFAGRLSTHETILAPEIMKFLRWAKERQAVTILANVDTGPEAEEARKIGAHGVGLCCTERVFFDREAVPKVWRALLSRSPQDRLHAIDALRTLQRGSFLDILRAMEGLPVTVRLFDHPLIEFLPRQENEVERAASDLGLPSEGIRMRVQGLMQANPALGHRGCRLGVANPDLYDMQVQALTEAALQLLAEGKKVFPQIVLPFVSTVGEVIWARKRFQPLIEKLVDEWMGRHGPVPGWFGIPIGVMIETPRAALIADKLAQYSDFFCIGSQDLTELTFGLSHDDAAPFLRAYKQEAILNDDPTAVIDTEGVGLLVAKAIELGRGVKPNLPIGVCTEHDLNRAELLFGGKLGIDYLTCSPMKVPIAILNSARVVNR
jgi:pyruvate,orthophosphate dikinase